MPCFLWIYYLIYSFFFFTPVLFVSFFFFIYFSFFLFMPLNLSFIFTPIINFYSFFRHDFFLLAHIFKSANISFFLNVLIDFIWHVFTLGLVYYYFLSSFFFYFSFYCKHFICNVISLYLLIFHLCRLLYSFKSFLFFLIFLFHFLALFRIRILFRSYRFPSFLIMYLLFISFFFSLLLHWLSLFFYISTFIAIKFFLRIFLFH